jgi:hypothetical protein
MPIMSSITGLMGPQHHSTLPHMMLAAAILLGLATHFTAAATETMLPEQCKACMLMCMAECTLLGSKSTAAGRTVGSRSRLLSRVTTGLPTTFEPTVIDGYR